MSNVVATNYGKVQGVTINSALDVNYTAFYGIPYAKPPVGRLRFKDPRTPERWEGIYDASKEKLCCIGRDSYLKKIVGSEDCLHLNIYTKNVSSRKSLPVMVYFFGGAFQTGSTSTDLYSPDYLLMADVIVVMLSFRFGPLGFMSFKDETLKITGNACLKDQLMGLQYVKHNIEYFGGDANNITLFGHSSGAMSINLLSANEQAKGLFNRAIIMSDFILKDSYLTQREQNWALRLAMKLGYSGNDEDKDVLEFLQNADPIRMVEEQNNLILPEESKRTQFAFKPNLETYFNELASKSPIEMTREAWGNDIDMIFGCVSDEGLNQLTYINRNPQMITKLDLKDKIPTDLNLNLDDDQSRSKFAEQLQTFYFPNINPNDVESEETKNGFCRLVADKELLLPLSRSIRSRQNSSGKGKTYFYRFAFDSPTMNTFRTQRNRPNARGVDHADNLSYIFKHNYGPICEKDSKEFSVIKNYISFLTSFATTGSPNDDVAQIATGNVILWKEVDSKTPPFKCLNISETIEFKDNPDTDRIALWEEMYTETNTPLY
ncbi:CLUMA_CG011937, isoform A [Clunio marinus]|uniref:Carboxylic ester hydrolase n=1 Tax=Clunio marinus TaxID=568069 RepID=A0A1J1IEF8_9DIPT|nr:CLUMA_CG011937, isoform A [Clunio marinus]